MEPTQDTSAALAPVRRGLAILRRLATDHDRCSFSALQRDCGNLPAPTLSRLLKVLVSEGLVERDPGHGMYRLGPSMLELARMALGSRPRGLLLGPVVASLAGETGQSAAFYELDDTGLRIAAKAEQPNSCHYMDVGRYNRQTTHHGFWRAVLAFVSASRLERCLALPNDLKPLSGSQFRRTLEQVRSASVCTERGESWEGWVRYAAPVFAAGEAEATGAIGISVPAGQARGSAERRFIALVIGSARRASSLLGADFDASVGSARQAEHAAALTTPGA
jgi:DNA-binding IclR family transcriptional regulator